ncbi:MAG: helix-turn-helix transcriptional regulator [Clostridiales bacterium]|nr:helix-turn-helix transcriptional regulator [Clostridiales bacterium]
MFVSRFHEIIAEKRKEKGISQVELARLMNVTKQAVSKWETGKSMPDMALLPKLAEVLGVSVDEILTGKEPVRQAESARQAQSVEQEQTVENEAPRKRSVRKLCAIVVPILVLAIIASTLMGVYIPRAMDKPPIDSGVIDNPEPPTPTPTEPTEKEYTKVEICGHDKTHRGAYKATAVDGWAYYSFTPHFNSDYEFCLTTYEEAKVTMNGEELEWYEKELRGSYVYYREWRYLKAGEEVKFEVDMTEYEISYKDYSTLYVKQKQGFDKLTIPANSEYVVILDNMSVLERYRILTDGVVFSDLRKQLEFGRDYQTEYTRPHSIWNHYESSLATFELSDSTLNTTRSFENSYCYIVLKNYNDEAVRVEIVKEDIEEIGFNTLYEITFGDSQDYYYFKFKIEESAAYCLKHNTFMTFPVDIFDDSGHKTGYDEHTPYPTNIIEINGETYFSNDMHFNGKGEYYIKIKHNYVVTPDYISLKGPFRFIIEKKAW